MIRRATTAIAVIAALSAIPASALAGPPADAIVHFDKGLALYDRGAWAAALAEFREAERRYPEFPSAVYNAGRCLEELQRYDEALDAFEALLRNFGGALPAQQKASVQRKVVAMRALTGTLDVEGAEPGAAISIDGQRRGEYPLLSPVRVAAGSHVVRVFKEGYDPVEVRVEIAGGQTARVQAPMHALRRSGKLRITEQGNQALEVLIDDAVVGKTPWEGQLALGDHLVILRGERNLGTQPVSISVKEGRTTPLTLAAVDLDASLRVEPTPANARVLVDSVAVGHGLWDGRLQKGAHAVEVAAPGFFTETRRVSLPRGKRLVLAIALTRDPASPLWPKPPRRARFTLELGAGPAFAPMFGGDIAGACAGDCQSSAGVGLLSVVHGGYEFGSGLGLGLTAGALSATQAVSGRQTSVKPLVMNADPGLADDRLVLRGVLVGAWVGWSFFQRFPIHLRVSTGALLGTAQDVRTFAGTANDGTSFEAGPVSETHAARLFYVTPEARVGLPLSARVEVSLGLSAPILIAPSPPRWNASHAIYAGSDRGGTFAADAFVGNVFVLFAPGVGARYDF